MKILSWLFFALSFFSLLGCTTASTENLLKNGDAEMPKFDTVPTSWTNVKGTWVSAEGDSTKHDYGFAQHGSRYFFAGYGLTGILQQDVDVSNLAGKIDGNKQQFILSGFEQTLDQGKISDQGMLKLACLDAAKNKVLYQHQTDTIMSVSKWQSLADTFLAPPNTRFIRVQLVAFRNVGGDNDGYFDNISLTAITGQNYWLIIGSVILVLLLITFFIYLKNKKRLTA